MNELSKRTFDKSLTLHLASYFSTGEIELLLSLVKIFFTNFVFNF